MTNNAIVPHSDSNHQIFNFEGHDLHAALDSGEYVFYAQEVCEMAGLSNVSQALSRLDDDEKREIISNDVTGRQQYVWAVTESGLYSLIGNSRKPMAKKFKRWINHDVIPSIRKTGGYSIQSMSPAEIILMQAQKLVDIERAQKEDRRAITELYVKQGETALQIEGIAEKLLDADYFTVLQFCQRQRINVSASVRSKWGKDATDLSREQGIEVKSVVEGRYSVGRYHKSILLIVCVPVQKKPPDQMTLF